jgi:hypothetical protein
MNFEFQFSPSGNGGDYINYTSRSIRQVGLLLKATPDEAGSVKMRVLVRNLPEGYNVEDIGLYLVAGNSFGEFNQIQTIDDPAASLDAIQSFDNSAEKGLRVKMNPNNAYFNRTQGISISNPIVISSAPVSSGGHVDFTLEFFYDQTAYRDTKLYLGLEATGILVPANG